MCESFFFLVSFLWPFILRRDFLHLFIPDEPDEKKSGFPHNRHEIGASVPSNYLWRVGLPTYWNMEKNKNRFKIAATTSLFVSFVCCGRAVVCLWFRSVRVGWNCERNARIVTILGACVWNGRTSTTRWNTQMSVIRRKIAYRGIVNGVRNGIDEFFVF